MLVQDVMTTPVVTIELDDRLDLIQEIFDHAKFHHLIVVNEHNKIQGVISDKDLLRGLSPFIGKRAERQQDLRTLKLRAHQIMARDPCTLAPQQDIHAAARIMLDQHRIWLPVVHEQTPIGVLGWSDVMGHLIGYTGYNQPPA